MSILIKIGTAAASRLANKFAKKLTAKQLAASRKNIQKAIAARVRMAGNSVVTVAKNPVKAYAVTVSSRVVKSRAKAATKTATQLKFAKSSAASLNSRFVESSRKLAVQQGAKANILNSLEGQRAASQAILKKIDRKGTDGVFGYLRKREANRIGKSISVLDSELSAQRAGIVSLNRATASLGGNLASAQGQIDVLTARYSKLSGKASFSDYAKLIGQDAAVIGGITVAATTINNRNKKTKN